VSGGVVPEPLFARRDYEEMLEGIYRDLEPLDPQGVLRHEWVNARGCIARFDRMAVEIRVLDVQECPRADVAIAAAVTATLRGLCDPDPRHQARLRALATGDLVRTLRACAAEGDRARVDAPDLLRALGLDATPVSARVLWERLLERSSWDDAGAAEHRPVLEHLLGQGCLARRMRARVGGDPTPEALRELGRALCDCLATGRLLGEAGAGARAVSTSP
jgi:hypothetical protein